MIKKQQKWIALLVVCTFMWLMQVSTMPVAAAGTTEQVSSASAEQGPDYYEAVGQKAAPAKKKSMLPIILIGVGLLAVTAAVLFLFVLKKYDITGTWAVTTIWSGYSASHFTLVFTGTKKAGIFLEGYWTGTYTVDGKNATWKYDLWPTMIFSGAFTDKDSISGTMVDTGWSGTFTAVRTADAARIDNSGPGGKGVIADK